MYKAVGIWSRPADDQVDAFEQHYRSTHVPLAQRLPGVQRVDILFAGEEGREPNIYRIAQVYWADASAFAAASESPEWAAMVEDATGMMERWGVTLTSAHGDEELIVGQPLTESTSV